MKKFIYKRSILNVAVLVWMILGTIFLVEHWEDVGTEQGQGMSTSLLWIGVAIAGIIIDILLQYFIDKRSTINIIEGILVGGFVLSVRAFLIQ